MDSIRTEELRMPSLIRRISRCLSNQLQSQLLGQLETQYVLYQNRLELIRLEVKNVEVAKENAELALDRFKVGRSNSLALREAQLNAVQAAGRLLNALYEAKLAEIEI